MQEAPSLNLLAGNSKSASHGGPSKRRAGTTVKWKHFENGHAARLLFGSVELSLAPRSSQTHCLLLEQIIRECPDTGLPTALYPGLRFWQALLELALQCVEPCFQCT